VKPRAATLRRALRSGLVVRVGGVAPGTRVALTARTGRKVVARGAARAGKRGAATVTLRFTPAARRTLRAKRSVALTVAGAGATARVTLRR
jgi:hypothetical protein